MKSLQVIVLLAVATVYGDPEVPSIVPAYAASPIHHTAPPATLSYAPAAFKVSEHLQPVLKYVKAPLAVKTPAATSYATTTSVHVTHPLPKVAVHAPILKYAEPVAAVSELKFAAEPEAASIYKYAVPAPVVKYAAEPVTGPVYKYAASAPIVRFAAEPVTAPVYKYAAPAPVVKYAAEPVTGPVYKFAAEPVAAPIFKTYTEHAPVFKYNAESVLEHEHSFDYAPSYAHELESLGSYH